MKYEQFDKPTQVLFWDYDGEHWAAGIAYGGIIICGCCGGIFELEEVNTYAPDNISNPIISLEWIDLTQEIAGEEMSPEIFQKKNEVSAWFVDNFD